MSARVTWLYMLVGAGLLLACTRNLGKPSNSAVTKSLLAPSTCCGQEVSVSSAVLQQTLITLWQQHTENRFTLADYTRWWHAQAGHGSLVTPRLAVPTDYALFEVHEQHYQYERTFWRLKTPDGKLLYRVQIETTGPHTSRLCVTPLRSLAPSTTTAGSGQLSEAELTAACSAIQADLRQKLPVLSRPSLTE